MKVFSEFNDEVAQLIISGAVGVSATDTIYGLVCRLDDKKAVERIYQLKGREEKPIGTILIGSSKQISSLVPDSQLKIAESYWPGPYSMVLDVGEEFKYAHRGLDSLAFRLPAYPELVSFVLKTGPLATTSANLTGDPPIVNINQAQELFGNNVDFYIDGGDLSNHQASRIIKILKDGNEVVLR